MVWKEAIIKPGKFPEKPFEAVLKTIYKSRAADQEVIKLDFENDITITIFGVNQLDQDGSVAGFKDIAKFLASLIENGIKPSFDIQEDGTVTGFRTDPDITGRKLSMDCNVKEYVDGKGDKKTGRNWFIKRVYPAAAAQIPAQTSAIGTQSQQSATSLSVPQAPVLDPTLLGIWKDVLLDILDSPKSENGIHLAVKTVVTPDFVKARGIDTSDLVLRSRLAEIRKPVLKFLVEQGYLKLDGDKYSIVV